MALPAPWSYALRSQRESFRADKMLSRCTLSIWSFLSPLIVGIVRIAY
jgi:hypothetical protein